MPLISVVTAAYAPTAAYIRDTADSIAATQLPDGWQLEWIVQEDGDTPGLRDTISRYSFARYSANGRQYGTACTRNLALSRASGVLVQALDQDDLLLPHVFTALIPRFAEHPIGWAIGQADDLLPDGTRRPYASPIRFGLWSASKINAWASEHEGNWPIHCATLMMRTSLLRALGGWTGQPYDDELATFAALSQMIDGYYDQELTWLYRHHPQQLHRTKEATENSAVGRRTALLRARAVSATGLRFSPESLAGFESSDNDVHVGPVDKDTTLPASV